jgi:peptide/nickel transport system substrate-binding protein
MRSVVFVIGFSVLAASVACASPQPSGGAATGGGVKEGGRLNLSLRVDPIDYDPTYNGKTVPGDAALAQAYDSLLGFKSGPGVDYNDMVIVPRLAERWEVSPDSRTFTFTIRKGVKFADLPPVNGRELTAQDVKWTFEYFNRFGEFKQLPPASHVGTMFEGMESVEAPTADTVVVRFKDPFIPFLAYTASQWNVIMPREIYEKEGSFKDTLVGSGPFQLDTAATQKSAVWVWKRNPTHWDNANVHLDEVRWLILKEDATIQAAFRTKQVDVLGTGLGYVSYGQVKAGSPDAQYFPTLQPQGYRVHFSQVRPGPLNDVRVRRALALSIDRDEINKVVAGGEGRWAVPAMPGLFTDAEVKQLQQQDVEQAKRLLAEAGQSSGLTLNWPIENDMSQEDINWILLVQAQMKRAGVNVNLDRMDKNAQRAKRRVGDFDIDIIQGLGLLEADIDSTLFGTLHSKGSTNWPKIRDTELDKLLQAQRSEADPEKRKQIQRDAVRRVIDQAWGAELIYPPIWFAAQSYVKNYYPHFSSRGPYTPAWLDK